MKTLLAMVIAMLLAAPASALPVVRYTWGPASGAVQDQSWVGPMAYAQTLSVTGLIGSVSQIEVMIQFGGYGDSQAWSLLAAGPYPVSLPVPDCTGAPGFTVSSTVAGATSILNAVVSAETGITSNPGSAAGPHGLLTITVSIDPPLLASPDVRYGIATLQYDLENAEFGASYPALCDNAGAPHCWAGMWAYTSTGGAVWENQYTTWEALPVWDCNRVATEALRPTWGRLKQLYR